MSILTALYRFEKLAERKSKLRLDMMAGVGDYMPLERLRNPKGDLFLYAGVNYTKAGEKGKSDIAVSKGKHITSLFSGDLSKPFAVGDFHDTPDALVFVFSNAQWVNGAFSPGSVIEIFVAPTFAKNRNALFTLLADGELAEDMERLRRAAK